MLPHLDRILTINLICSTLIFYVGARIYLLPKIAKCFLSVRTYASQTQRHG